MRWKKGVDVPEDRLIFVGDSLRGDIGSGLTARLKNKEISGGQGILVLRNRKDLFEIEEEINKNPDLRLMADSMKIYGFIVEDVPLDEKGNPMLLSRFQDKFLKNFNLF